MNRSLHHQASPHLKRPISLLELGHAGVPLVVFPTAPGHIEEFEANALTPALREKLEAGLLHVYCVDSIDDESWFATSLSPQQRIQRHNDYEAYLLNEVLPLTACETVSVMGCALGGFHAINFALRHPDRVRHCISLGGAYDLTGLLGDYRGEDFYFHQPLMYLPNDTDGWYWDHYQKLTLILAAGEQDPCLADNRRLSEVLRQRSIPHWLDIWGDGTRHGWEVWRQMLLKYL